LYSIDRREEDDKRRQGTEEASHNSIPIPDNGEAHGFPGRGWIIG